VTGGRLGRRLGWLIVGGGLAAAAMGGGLWALPEVVRRVALVQIPRVTGRAVGIEDIDLNLFTGRLAIKNFWLAERAGPEAFIRFDRLDLRLRPWALVMLDVRLAALRLSGLRMRVIRTGAAEFNFSDLLERVPPPDPAQTPSRWTVTMDRLALADGHIMIEDRAVSPAVDWSLADLRVEMAGVTTREGRAPGRAELWARLGGASLHVVAPALHLAPVESTHTVEVRGFDIARVGPYWPAELPVALAAGEARVRVEMDWKRDAEAVRRFVLRGDVGVDRLALVDDERGASLLTLERLAVSIGQVDVLARTAVLAAVELAGLDVRAERDPAGAFDFIVTYERWLARVAARERARAGPAPRAGSAPPGPPARPAPGQAPPGAASGPPPLSEAEWRLRLERLTMRDGLVVLGDRAVSPAIEWRIEGLGVDAAGLSTAHGDAPGSGRLQAHIASSFGKGRPAALTVEADALRLLPLTASLRVTLSDLDVRPAAVYAPPSIPALPTRGRLSVDVTAKAERPAGQVDFDLLSAAGQIRLADLAVAARGSSRPFLDLPRLTVGIREANSVTGLLHLGAMEVDRLRLRAVRGVDGRIDLLDLALAGAGTPAEVATGTPRGAATTRTAAPPAVPGPVAGWRARLDRLALTRGTATFEDTATSPPVTLVLADLAASAVDFTWPPSAPTTLSLSVSMPGGGRTALTLTGLLAPVDVQFTTSTRDAPIEPYGAYFPFPARFAGLFSGDSVSEIKREADDRWLLASRGTAWARDLELRDSTTGTAVARMAGMEIKGIDFSWPNYALVSRVTLTRPEIQVERDEQGEINLRRLFLAGTADRPDETPSAPTVAASPRGTEAPAPTEPSLLQRITLDFSDITLEDGYARFLDRTTTPHFSQDVSRLTLTIRDLSNERGRGQPTLSAQAVIGGDAALDIRGELSGIGESLRADLVGELRDYRLTSANPYADRLTSWIIQQGTLTAKVHYHIEGDRLSAEHDVNFGRLRVARARESDEAKRRLGLPLGLAVAMLKDHRGDIDFSIPLHGILSDRTFDWGEAMWAAVKQVIVKGLRSPFNAIGRLFTGADDKADPLEVSPLGFAAGSAVVSPSGEAHLTRVADFLRRSPYVALTLTPVATAADVEGLKSQALTARVRQLQEERGIKEFDAAVGAHYEEQGLPGGAAATPKEQFDRLLAREPAPDAMLAALAERRSEATRRALTRTEGIPAERLRVAAPRVEAAGGSEGRIEFALADE
jgi:hypothetical protein